LIQECLTEAAMLCGKSRRIQTVVKKSTETSAETLVGSGNGINDLRGHSRKTSKRYPAEYQTLSSRIANIIQPTG
jgi:hypothetical protein